MGLETFVRIVNKRTELFEKGLSRAVSGLTLKDVLDEVGFSADRYYLKHSDFERGMPIESGLMCNTFRFSICLDKAVLTGPYNLTVKKFEGQEVIRVYDEWCAGIKKAEDDYEPPF
ncbi:MAG: hypothetical protein US31_C0015G0004 [Berkelbacteria bacterium GW2011_GWA1_36_9]|uniref:Uncharacterized protein n=1 Tax=Berkelbacteria bacterium GW2011_GWA1_36_9 TaxID=1618331 RepID=A0A0G0FFF4_9BACT|nr:MAG: hypothetical protein US31_C0015G0004 [Berkelbacteria bacterium GW2011_GWA1_36_9]